MFPRLVRQLIVLAAAVILLGTTVVEQHLHQKFPPEQFEKPERAAWQKPDEVIAKLNLKAGDVIADIGAGSGYFSRRFAKAVAPTGIVYAVDIDPDMLYYIHKRAEKENQHNIVTVLCSANDPMLAPQSVDLVFICDTIHHITNRSDYYKRIQRCLKPGGRLAIVDFQKRKLPIGPPVEAKIAREVMRKEAMDAGFVFVEDFDFLPYQYFLVFKFPSTSR